MDDVALRRLFDEWKASERDDFIFQLKRGHIQPGRSFSDEAVREVMEMIGVFVGARLTRRWLKTGEPPTVATIRVEVSVG